MTNDDKYDFNRDFIEKIIREYERHLTQPNQEKITLVQTVGISVSAAISHKGTRITTSLHDPSPEMGCVWINGKRIEVTDTEKFAMCMKKSSNFEVTPKTDGTVDADFGFHGLMEVKA
jgi:hypothetical protein